MVYKGPLLRVDFSHGVQIWMLVFAGIGLVQCLLMMLIIVADYFKFQPPEFYILICLGTPTQNRSRQNDRLV